MADFDAESLAEALKKRKLREAEQLLLVGVNPNGLVEHGTLTPMHLAAGLGLESVCLLLQHGGDPNICIQDRTTPLHVASMWGDADSLQILLANGGDPFLKDLDGMSALDLADQYQHDDVKEVLQHYMSVLSRTVDQTMTPKFTYIRRSSISSTASQQSTGSPADPDEEDSPDVSLYNSQALHDYLKEFAKRRRSSMYLRSIQSQVNRYFGDGQKTHLVDVTSPDHPYIEPRLEEEAGDESCDQSLNLQLSLSEDEQSACDSFVTCDGEGLAMVLNSSEEDSPFDRSLDCMSTVKKNPKHSTAPSPVKSFNNNCSSESTLTEIVSSQGRQPMANRSRVDKYCRREPLFKPPDLTSISSLLKCDYCGCVADTTAEKDETVCKTCEKLGIELDLIMHEASDKETKDKSVSLKDGTSSNTLNLPDLIQTRVVDNNWPFSADCADQCGSRDNRDFYEDHNSKYFQVGKSHSASRAVPKRDAFTELSRQLKRTSLNTMLYDVEDKTENALMKVAPRPNVQEYHSSITNCSQSTTDRADVGFCKSDLSDSLISADSTFPQAPITQAKFHPSDISTITLDDNSYEDRNLLDQAYVETTASRITQTETLRPKILFNKNHVKGSQKDEYERVKNVGIDNRRIAEEIRGAVVDTRKPSLCDDRSPGINDLWSEVRASSLKQRRLKQQDVLDTAFCGRDSLGSVLSEASTVEYVYTDKETGIVLLERHIPSQCGSSGSRRSLDSLFSQNTNENISPKSEPADLDLSQETVLYDWQDNAMIQVPDDQEGKDANCQMSPDLLNLDNETLRKTLADLGDDPGPVTKTTRQAYLRRLSQIQNDPDARWLTKKGPDFPPELRAALSGTLDLSEMSELELKMVSTFQNPDRQRRWREGTLKSSFNYVLLDPRITRDLPNRSANMTDLEVFKTFVYATFYVGKGKRARPYSHLYEAIREMKKPSGKASDKVQKILEIWSGDQGVVSLHCFQSVIPVEAYTREACMVDALGLAHLTNKKRGDYYGVSTTYSMKQRRKMGVFLMSKALQIFLAEGERQISPLDIKNDP